MHREWMIKLTIILIVLMFRLSIVAICGLTRRTGRARNGFDEACQGSASDLCGGLFESFNRKESARMKSKNRKRFVPLVAGLALAVTIVVLATPGSTAASGGSFYIQGGWAQWYPSYADCVGCWVRFVDNNTGVVSSVKVGDFTGPGHYTATLNPAHEYHIYLYYQGDFCPAFSLPNPDIIYPNPYLTDGVAPGRSLLLEGKPGTSPGPCPQ